MKTRRSLSLAALVTLLAVSAAPVLAKCRSPRPFLAPGPGAAVPPSPTLYLFVPHAPDGIGEILATGDGVPLEVNVEQLSGPSAFDVYSVTVRTGRATTFTVASAKELFSPQEYSIDRGWAVRRGPVEILAAKRERYEWTCMGPFRGQPQEEILDVLELGHVDCIGNTMEFSDTPFHVGVVALFSDGTESATPPKSSVIKLRPPK